MSVSREMLTVLRTDITAALAPVVKKHNLAKLVAGNCTFSEGGFTFKLEGLIKGGLVKEQEAYNVSREYDKRLPALGHAFTFRGARYTIYGRKPSGHKIICDNIGNGKKYLFERDAVLRACGVPEVELSKAAKLF